MIVNLILCNSRWYVLFTTSDLTSTGDVSPPSDNERGGDNMRKQGEGLKTK